jgi:hypothetical protein
MSGMYQFQVLNASTFKSKIRGGMIFEAFLREAGSQGYFDAFTEISFGHISEILLNHI